MNHWGRRIRVAAASGIAVASVVVAVPRASAAADSNGPWHAVTGSIPQARGGQASYIHPTSYSAYTLDRAGMASALASAPSEFSAAARRGGGVTISLPTPSGDFQRFRIESSPVMEPGLAAEHPEIQTYAGQGIDDPTESIRLDLTPLGFNASVRGDDGAWYVDPYYHLSQSLYISYFGEALGSDPHGTFVDHGTAGESKTTATTDFPNLSVGTQLRTYRLALASDPGYYTFFGSSNDNVTAAKVALINRIDEIYTSELSIKLVLVDGNDALNYDTQTEFSNAGYTSDECDDDMLTDNQAAVTAAIGSGNYDIGHIVLGADGGGLAAVGVVGSATQKAEGCTGITTPVGDQFAVDYVAHEMGHEFGAFHTFNGFDDNCGYGNRDESTSVEPGSGSSIMAYAGICGNDDLQPHSDPYFSAASFDQIETYTSATNANSPGNNGTVTSTGDSAPVVTTDPGPYTIPTRTPFALTGSATDADNDPLTYMWEQIDPELDSTGTNLQNANKTSGPLFRQFGTALDVGSYDGGSYDAAGENDPTSDPTRVFPDMAQILANNTDANTGACPGGALSLVDCYSEWLPTSVYPGPMHFRLTARDNRGGVANADTQVNVATGAGPFLVTSPNTDVTYQGGSQQTVTWDVAGTDQSPVSTSSVDILLSTDGGQTFPTTLVSSTPNDGSDTVTIPNVDTSQARIEVRAHGNVYFDVSDTDFTITPSDLPPPTQHMLTVATSGTGRVTSSPAGISCPTTCSKAYDDGTAVVLTATAGSGFSFDHWVNCSSAAANKCTEVVSSDKTITAVFTAAPKPTFVPDLWIKAASGGYLGNNVHNATGSHQSKTEKVARRHKATFYVKAQNDGSAPDWFTVIGAGSAKWFSVKYFSGKKNITGSHGALRSSYGTSARRIAAGAVSATPIRIVVTVSKKAHHKAKRTLAITMTSGRNKTKRDVVKAVVTVK